jgi:hypothetical protein
MYSEQDRVQIRRFLGFGAIFKQADPRVENAITSTQSEADGGSQPDSSSENEIKGLIYGTTGTTGTAVTPGGTAQNVAFSQPALPGLLTIEQQLAGMWGFTFAAGKQDDATVDTYRAMIQLRSEGRRMVRALARHLGMKGPRIDMFAGGAGIGDGEPFWGNDSIFW